MGVVAVVGSNWFDGLCVCGSVDGLCFCLCLCCWFVFVFVFVCVGVVMGLDRLIGVSLVCVCVLCVEPVRLRERGIKMGVGKPRK